MTKSERHFATAGKRVTLSIILGLAGGLAVGSLTGWKYAPLVSWDFAATIFLVWIWVSLRPLNAEQTKGLAVREDPGRAVSDLLLIVASIASLGAVGFLLAHTGDESGTSKIIQGGIAITSVVISWAMVHNVYALKYARQYYRDNGGVDFNDKQDPCYLDFAYLSFTVGMTFQVSDTSVKTTAFRRLILRQALLSYLFGTVIVATTINLVVGLGK